MKERKTEKEPIYQNAHNKKVGVLKDGTSDSESDHPYENVYRDKTGQFKKHGPELVEERDSGYSSRPGSTQRQEEKFHQKDLPYENVYRDMTGQLKVCEQDDVIQMDSGHSSRSGSAHRNEQLHGKAQVTTFVVDKHGGHFDLKTMDIQMVILKDDVQRKTKICVQKCPSDPIQMPSGRIPLSEILDIQPYGAKFNKSISLKIPTHSLSGNKTGISILTWTGSEWKRFPDKGSSQDGYMFLGNYCFLTTSKLGKFLVVREQIESNLAIAAGNCNNNNNNDSEDEHDNIESASGWYAIISGVKTGEDQVTLQIRATSHRQEANEKDVLLPLDEFDSNCCLITDIKLNGLKISPGNHGNSEMKKKLSKKQIKTDVIQYPLNIKRSDWSACAITVISVKDGSRGMCCFGVYENDPYVFCHTLNMDWFEDLPERYVDSPQRSMAVDEYDIPEESGPNKINLFYQNEDPEEGQLDMADTDENDQYEPFSAVHGETSNGNETEGEAPGITLPVESGPNEGPEKGQLAIANNDKNDQYEQHKAVHKEASSGDETEGEASAIPLPVYWLVGVEMAHKARQEAREECALSDGQNSKPFKNFLVDEIAPALSPNIIEYLKTKIVHVGELTRREVIKYLLMDHQFGLHQRLYRALLHHSHIKNDKMEKLAKTFLLEIRKENIWKRMTYFSERMTDVRCMYDDLVSKHVIKERQKAYIDAKDSPIEGSRFFLEEVLLKSDGSSFEKFLQALRDQNNKELADMMSLDPDANDML